MPAARAEEPDHANDVLEEIRQEISASDDDLKEARERPDLVSNAAASFPGALRTFRSGLVAHGNVTNLVNDTDGGMVLDRRVYVELGPDSSEGATAQCSRVRATATSGSGPRHSCSAPDSRAAGEHGGQGLGVRVLVAGDREVDPWTVAAALWNRSRGPGVIAV